MISKGFWKQLGEAESLGFTGQVRQHDLEISTEIPQELSARATGRCEFVRVGYNDDPRKAFRPFGKRFEQGNPFRTNRQTVAGAFNVAARKHSPVATEQSRAHLES